jgi:hypothetical protein
MGAANGVFVNGERVQIALLRSGDILILGHPAGPKHKLGGDKLPDSSWSKSPYAFRVTNSDEQQSAPASSLKKRKSSTTAPSASSTSLQRTSSATKKSKAASSSSSASAGSSLQPIQSDDEEESEFYDCHPPSQDKSSLSAKDQSAIAEIEARAQQIQKEMSAELQAKEMVCTFSCKFSSHFT